MLETWKRATEKVKVISDLLTDSKGCNLLILTITSFGVTLIIPCYKRTPNII